MLPPVIFVLGGAASGKSVFAESLILNSGLDPHYVATLRPHDAEMVQKIELHKSRRGSNWGLSDAQSDLGETLRAIPAHTATLLDCATMWLTNQMMDGASLDGAPSEFVEILRQCGGPIVVVSNEVGQGIVPDNAMARQFREAQGRLNIAVAGAADVVVQVVAGLPHVLKGTLP